MYSSQNQIQHFSLERFVNNSLHARILSRLLKPQTNRKTGPPVVNDDGLRLLGRSNPWQTRFLSRSLSGAVRKNATIMGKVAKGKRKTSSKNEKIGKCAEGQDNESTYSSQNYDSRRLLMFSYQGWYLHK